MKKKKKKPQPKQVSSKPAAKGKPTRLTDNQFFNLNFLAHYSWPQSVERFNTRSLNVMVEKKYVRLVDAKIHGLGANIHILPKALVKLTVYGRRVWARESRRRKRT